MKQEKSFGLIFSLVFLILSLYQLVNTKNINFFLLGISFLFFLAAFFFPRVLVIPNRAWLNLGKLLGTITTPVIMFIIFYLIVTPTSLLLKLFKKRLLIKYRKTQTYWMHREDRSTDMSNQF